LVQALSLGFAVQSDGQHVQPAAKRIVVVFNANDNSINNALTMDVVNIWKVHSANLTTYEFEASLELGHDLIDPAQPDQQVEIVYPTLIDLISQ